MHLRTLVACALAAATVAGAAPGCVPSSVPILPQDVASALARHPMRAVETEHLIVYYPEGRQDEARRLATYVEGCAGYLVRVAQIHNSVSDQKMIVLFADLPLNNAFVTPRVLGYDTQAIIPTSDTIDLFSLELGQPPDPGETACHEIVHYVHLQQIGGFFWFINAAFGAVLTPQVGLDLWFDEGLAVYYETKLQPGTGRLAWPFWRGVFAAAYAGHRINGGDLSLFQRDFHAGNHYLVGSQFVRFLADRYGEQKLWRLINVQGRSIFFPLWVNLRFWQAYDKTLSTLIDEFADEVATNLPARARPAGQRVVRPAGYSARYARAADGTEALITADHDQPARLQIFAPDGKLRAERNLTDVLPPRRLATGQPVLISGLGFTGDARTLYFVSIDLDPTYQASRLYRYDVGSDTLSVVNRDLHGPGGAISPDGRQYVFSRADGDHHDLAMLDLASGAARVVYQEGHGRFLSNPRFSPDGQRIVATEVDNSHFQLRVFDATSGQPVTTLPTGGAAVQDASWLDDHRVLYLGAAETSAGFQVYVHDLKTAHTQRISNAPYLAFEPRGGGDGTVRFLNREGWQWTIDEVALPPATPVAPVVAVAPAPAPQAPPAQETPQEPPQEAPAAATPAPASAAESPPPLVPAPPLPSGPSLPPSPPALAPSAPVTQVLSDKPYSPLRDLFIPRLYGPTLTAIGRSAQIYGLVLSGNDRLSLHRWTIAGYYQPQGGGEPSVLVGYTNRQLAPLTIEALAAQYKVHETSATTLPADYTEYRRDREATLNLLQFLYGNPIRLGFSYLETYRPDDLTVLRPLRRMAGPHLAASFAGVESTPYTGVRRLFAVTAQVADYPRQWNTTGSGFVDTFAAIDVVLPLPLAARHTLSLTGRGRDLVGATYPGLLTVGGYVSPLLGRHSNRPEIKTEESAVIPPGFGFTEPLRGFEDFPFTANKIVIGDATYRYPFIIDRGWASSLWLLPAFFVSQIDLELFGAAARVPVNDAPNHLAVGGALTLRTSLWTVPLAVQYQLARRITDDHGLTHLITLGN